jgi:mannose-6-phosphate isomerase-like protein (cupin superfamily)
MSHKEYLQVLSYDEQGYAPLVFSQGWQTAILNYEPGAEVDAVYRVERHKLTDEVFILWRGSGALVIAEPDTLRVVDAVPGVVYNVTIGTWHTVIGTRDSSWIIVENKDTHLGDTEYRNLTEDEMDSFLSHLPGWVDKKP